jgi:hypothetical protein
MMPVMGAPPSLSPEELSRRVREVHARIAPQVSDLGPGDVMLTLECMLRPWGSGRRFFLRESDPACMSSDEAFLVRLLKALADARARRALAARAVARAMGWAARSDARAR